MIKTIGYSDSIDIDDAFLTKEKIITCDICGETIIRLKEDFNGDFEIPVFDKYKFTRVDIKDCDRDGNDNRINHHIICMKCMNTLINTALELTKGEESHEYRLLQFYLKTEKAIKKCR